MLAGKVLRGRRRGLKTFVAIARGGELWLMPLVSTEGGGLLLKQRNQEGDRSTLIWEALPPGVSPVGERAAIWDHASGALRVDLR